VGQTLCGFLEMLVRVEAESAFAVLLVASSHPNLDLLGAVLNATASEACPVLCALNL
jgi:hypothetical protein